VNFCRFRAQSLDSSEVKSYSFKKLLGEECDEAKLRKALENEKYLLPILQEDALLSAPLPFCEDEFSSDSDADEQDKNKEQDPEKVINLLQKRIADLELAHSEYVQEVRSKLYGDTIEDEGEDELLKKRAHKDNESGSDSESDFEGDQDGYFLSYSGLGIHDDMLKDAERTGSYFNYITKNPSVFKDKV
jgi:hypothetical protein